MTLFPTTLLHGLAFNCISVSLICINSLNAELNPICYLLALLVAHYILYISGIRVKTVFRFNCYELRALYGYCMLVIIVNVGII